MLPISSFVLAGVLSKEMLLSPSFMFVGQTNVKQHVRLALSFVTDQLLAQAHCGASGMGRALELSDHFHACCGFGCRPQR